MTSKPVSSSTQDREDLTGGGEQETFCGERQLLKSCLRRRTTSGFSSNELLFLCLCQPSHGTNELSIVKLYPRFHKVMHAIALIEFRL